MGVGDRVGGGDGHGGGGQLPCPAHQSHGRVVSLSLSGSLCMSAFVALCLNKLGYFYNLVFLVFKELLI